jgi:DNA-binding response OmpR family regulator
MTKGLIWILQDETLPGQALLESSKSVDEYEIRSFTSLDEFSKALNNSAISHPRVLVLSFNTKNSGKIFEFLKERNSSGIDVGVVIVATNPSRTEVQQILAAGATDVYARPVSESTLLGKIDHLLTYGTISGTAIEFDPLKATLITHGKRSQPLTLKEYQILYFLNSSPEKMASRKLLLESLWAGSRVERKTVDMHVSNLRKKVANVGLQITYQAPDSFQLRFQISHSG